MQHSLLPNAWSHKPSLCLRSRRCVRSLVASPDAPSSSGRNLLDYAPTQQPASPGFLNPDAAPLQQWTRPQPATYTAPSVKNTGTLRPAAEWFPAWMRYRGREDNYVFWQDKFKRCSLDIPGVAQSQGSLHIPACVLEWNAAPPPCGSSRSACNAKSKHAALSCTLIVLFYFMLQP